MSSFVLLLAVIYILTAIFITPNKMEAFWVPGDATLMVGLSLIYFFVSQLTPLKKRFLLTAIAGFGVVYSVWTLYLAIISTTQNSNFFSSGIFLTTLLPIYFSFFFREKDRFKKIFAAVLLFVITFSIAVSAIFSQNKIPEFTTAWKVAGFSLSQNPILGIGPGNYQTAFNLGRPKNAEPLNPSFISKILAETGLSGFLAFLGIIYFLLKQTKENLKQLSPEIAAACISTAFLFLYPVNILNLTLYFTLVGIINNNDKNNYSFSLKTIPPPYLILFLMGISFLIYKLLVFSMAEYKFYQAQKEIRNNNIRETYKLLGEAIKLNPNVDRYHLTASSFNFALASSLSKKEKLSEEEKQQIGVLVQSAINEAKAAVALNDQRAGNWEVLAKIYHLMIPFAKGSDKFALETYKQAIALDPQNPQLRLKLGEIYFLQENYPAAIAAFSSAIELKKDFANAHYNLGLAFKKNKEFENAYREFSTALDLIPKESEDYQKVKKEIDELLPYRR